MTKFSTDAIGVVSKPSEFTLEADAGIAYAYATNDPIKEHREGILIPPIYSVVPVWEQVFGVVGKTVPEEHFFSVVHGEQDMMFYEPLKAGITLRSFAKGECISVKESGTTLVVSTQSFDTANDKLVIEQYFTMFFRGVNGGVNAGTAHDTGLDRELYENIIMEGQNSPAFISSTTAHMDTDQTTRYAQASGDYMPIHIDDDFARSVGLPGIIIHGLCTMAHASWAAISTVGDSDPTSLARISVRFARPLRPGDDLVTRIFSSESASHVHNTQQYYFHSLRDSDDEAILTNSLVEIVK